MRCILAVIWSVLLLSHQYNCYTEEDLAEALWNDTNNMLRRSEMNDICKFLMRNGNSDLDPASMNRISVNIYKSIYALLNYINEPLLEDALMKRIEWRCRQELLQQGLLEDPAGEPVYKRSEVEKVYIVQSLAESAQNNNKTKKVKFHSWGGKRTGELNNDAVIPNPSYRAKFHAWGGRKRSVPQTIPKAIAE